MKSIFKVSQGAIQLATAPRHVETRVTLAPLLIEQSDFPVIEPQEETEIYFTLQNLSPDTWKAGYYALVNINGITLGAPAQIALDNNVPPGLEVTWRLEITAPVVPGVHRTAWRFSRDGQLCGPTFWTDVVVIPGGSDDLAGIIGSMIEEARRDAAERFEEEWQNLRRQIIEMIWVEIVRRVEEFINELCGGSAGTVILLLSALWLGRRRSGCKCEELGNDQPARGA